MVMPFPYRGGPNENKLETSYIVDTAESARSRT